MNIYVSNPSYGLSEDDLKGAFEEYSEVTAAKIISGRARVVNKARPRS